jgi:putative transposase
MVACAHVVSHQRGILLGMQLRYRYRLEPTAEQRQALARAFGCARVVYNDALRLREDTHMAGRPFIPDGEVLRLVTTQAKRTPERAWLAEVSAVVLQQSVADLHRAYRTYFRELRDLKAERAMRNPKAKLRVRKPRFKSKRGEQAARFTANSRFRILANGRLSLPKVGDLAVRWSRPLPAPPSSVTVTLDCSGRYHASFVVEVARNPLAAVEREVGVDLGLHVLAASPRCLPTRPTCTAAWSSASTGGVRPRSNAPPAAPRRGRRGRPDSRSAPGPVRCARPPTTAT